MRGELAVVDGVDLGARVAVPVAEANARLPSDLLGLQEPLERLLERAVTAGFRDLRRILGLVAVAIAERRRQHLGNPRNQGGELDVGDVVALAREDHGLVRLDDELGVRKPPT